MKYCVMITNHKILFISFFLYFIIAIKSVRTFKRENDGNNGNNGNKEISFGRQQKKGSFVDIIAIMDI